MTLLRVNRPEQVADSDADPADGQWSQLELLIAMLLDETRFTRWEAAVSRLAKGEKKPKEPEPTPRPGVTTKRRKALPPHVAEFLFEHMNGNTPALPPPAA
ncbi:hypothetical protein [Spirillospora sp. NBC_01491]|uniref:hypothetical protein n=1 Tax=Spirillospora sp. NBC_01491 TaxID=2976007 RepID=UPI002E34B1F6|nr:hypothetical protein [Spirillospora sp. NBC_01491]